MPPDPRCSQRTGCTTEVAALRVLQVIEEKRALLRKYAPLLQYPYPKMLRPAAEGAARLGGAAAEGGRNAVTLALDRLAADVAVG